MPGPHGFAVRSIPRLRLKASPGTPDSTASFNKGIGAVRLHEGDRSQAKPALQSRFTPTLPRPPHPAPRF